MITESQKVDGMLRIAQWVEKNFHVNCTKSTVQFWKSLDPPFPASDEANRYDTGEVGEWMTDYLEKKGKLVNGELKLSMDAKQLEAKQRREIRKDKWDEMDFRKAQGLLIDRNKADITTKTALRMYHNFARTELERNLTDQRREKLKALGMSAEIIAEFYAWDVELARETVNNLETKCQEESK